MAAPSRASTLTDQQAHAIATAAADLAANQVVPGVSHEWRTLCRLLREAGLPVSFDEAHREAGRR